MISIALPKTHIALLETFLPRLRLSLGKDGLVNLSLSSNYPRLLQEDSF